MFRWIKGKVELFLFDHGFYRIDDINTRGHCGICGTPIEQPVLKVWTWGTCEQCASGKVIKCETCEHWQIGIPCGRCNHPKAPGLASTNDRCVFEYANKEWCPRMLERQSVI
jgi:hypothetical protein